MNPAARVQPVFLCSAPCADFDFQLAEACAAEDESSAEKLDCAELFAEEGRGYDQGGERINVAYKRRGLRRELLQRGKIHVVGKPGVDKAYDEDVNYIFRCRDDGQLHSAYRQVKYHNDK